MAFVIEARIRTRASARRDSAPSGAWPTQLARDFTADILAAGTRFSHVIRDRDAKFTAGFDAVFAAIGIHILPIAPQAPRMNAHAERWVETIPAECTDRMLTAGFTSPTWGARRVRHDYKAGRSHQGHGMNLRAPADDANIVALPVPTDQIRQRPILGGLPTNTRTPHEHPAQRRCADFHQHRWAGTLSAYYGLPRKPHDPAVASVLQWRFVPLSGIAFRLGSRCLASARVRLTVADGGMFVTSPRTSRKASARPASKSGPAQSASGQPAGADRARTVATVERAADVLLHFARADSQTLGVTEIATDLSMSKAAVHRILSSLVSRGLVQLDPTSRRYSLGPMSMTLGLTYLERLDVRRLAAPELHRLSAETNETATLSVRTGDARVYVDQVTPRREVIMSVSLGVPFPLHAGASSKAFLAFISAEQIDAYLESNLTRLTPNTITDHEALRRELKGIRERGWARSSAERQPGAASAAAPVFDHLGRPVAVISVCGPAERFDAEVDTCVGRLLRVTGSLSARMGYQPNGQP